MKKYNLLILAGEDKGPLYDEYGCLSKSLLPIHGKPMLDWVVEAFNNSPYIENIVVVGGDDLDRLSSMRYVRKRVPPGANIVQNLVQRASDKQHEYLISFCDAVFLETEMINETIRNIAESEADMVFLSAKKGIFDKTGLTAKRRHLPAGGHTDTGACLYHAKNPRMIAPLLDELMRRRESRKNPKAVLQILDREKQDVPDIEQTLSRVLSAKVKVLESPYPEMRMCVETPSDYELAKKRLTSPWKHSYHKAMIIYNPQAGQGMPLSPVLQDLFGIKRRKFEIYQSREGYLKKILEYLNKYDIEAQVSATEHGGHATQIARDCAQKGYDLVVAVGGDGTINEVINGLAGSDVTLGVVPLGTANVFGLEMKLPMEIDAACQVIASGKTKRIDLGQANGRYFACMAGVGFDAHVLKKADTKLKKVYGALAYAIVGVAELFTYRFRQIVIKIDEQPIRRKGYFVVVGNGKYYAGDMMFASKADLTDGYLDVCIFKHNNLISVFNYLFGFHRRDIDRHLSVEYFQCKELTIFKKGKHAVHVDAEYLCETPVEIKVCPKALKVAV